MEKTFGHTEETNNEVPQTQIQTSSDETTVAVANLTSILEESDTPNNQNREDELKKSAEEILNGVKRTVEVQVVNPNTFNFQDQTILGIFI